jgi:multidrug efflux pump subunit AcrA (membrane-fusion protein)
MSSRVIPLILIATSLVACKSKTTTVASLPTTVVGRGEVNVRVAATGVVEPINPVAIKSKASGMIIQLPVDVGSSVKRGH